MAAGTCCGEWLVSGYYLMLEFWVVGFRSLPLQACSCLAWGVCDAVAAKRWMGAIKAEQLHQGQVREMHSLGGAWSCPVHAKTGTKEGTIPPFPCLAEGRDSPHVTRTLLCFFHPCCMLALLWRLKKDRTRSVDDAAWSSSDSRHGRAVGSGTGWSSTLRGRGAKHLQDLSPFICSTFG